MLHGKASDSRVEDPDIVSRFCRSNEMSDLLIHTPVAALPDAWPDRVGTRTSWPTVSIA